MKAVVLKPGHRLALEDVPEPRTQDPGDMIVRVTATTICGSDVHIRHGQIPGIPPETVIGHEFVGVVEEVGAGVTRFRAGDRVAPPASVWCGFCPACRRGEVQHCINGGVWAGGELFGPGLGGAQTEYVRVPRADAFVNAIPDGVTDEQAIFVGDVLGTGFHAAREGGIRPGDTVVVLGCGPIGLGALASAWQFGPARVLAVDLLANRLAMAERFGATVVDAGAGGVAERIRDLTAGQGADVVIEAVGHPETFGTALETVRRGGVVSVVGLFPGPVEFPVHRLVFHGVRLAMGLGNLSYTPQLMALTAAGRIDLSPLATHTFPLERALEAYELFEHRKDTCLKVILRP